jgi:periplasmic protein TonB
MKRVPRVLLVAFALSLLLHLIVALILHPTTPTPESQAEVVSIEHRPATIAVTKPPTPPPPRPKQTPAPRTASSAPPARKGPGSAGTMGGNAPTPAPVVATATATPQPVTSAADCTRGDIAAAVTSTPAPPEIAPETRASGTSGVARVTVQLDSGGQVTGASIAQSTGNSSLDLVAVGMARAARYSPELHACKAVASSYTYSVKFVAW